MYFERKRDNQCSVQEFKIWLLALKFDCFHDTVEFDRIFSFQITKSLKNGNFSNYFVKKLLLILRSF